MRQIDINIRKEDIKRAQIKLERYEKGYFELYESAPLGYFILDANLKISNVNHAGAALLKTETNELIDCLFIQYTAPASYETIYSNIQLSETSDDTHKCEIELLNRKYVRLAIKSIFNSAGVLKNFIIVVSDLTEQKTAEINSFEAENLDNDEGEQVSLTEPMPIINNNVYPELPLDISRDIELILSDASDS